MIFVYHIPANIAYFTFFIIFGKNTKKSVLTCKILSYLFYFRSSKCVSRRHSVSETHLGLLFAFSSRGWGRTVARISLFLLISLPLSCLSLFCITFCSSVQNVLATRTSAQKEILGARARLRIKEAFQPSI